LGAIVSFYFGARHQAKGQEFQARVAQTMAQVPQVVDNLKALRALDAGQAVGVQAIATTGAEADEAEAADNPALTDWRRGAKSPYGDPSGGH
jgi:hypothetical protein